MAPEGLHACNRGETSMEFASRFSLAGKGWRWSSEATKRGIGRGRIALGYRGRGAAGASPVGRSGAKLGRVVVGPT